MKVTTKQKKMIELLKTAQSITYGVIWYAKINNRYKTLDGRTRNALVRKCILLHETENTYRLSEYV